MMKVKKKKGQKSVLLKKILSLETIKKCLKASKIGNIIDYLEKKEIDADCLKEDKK